MDGAPESSATPLLRHPPFAFLWSSRVLANVGSQMLAVAVGWQLYALTGSALDLGLVGLAEFAPITLEAVFSGIAFIRNRPVLLGTMSLDLFAVLLGGATALLPVYARDVLRVGPTGLGLMRSAPAIGALLTSIVLARYPIERGMGRTLFRAVMVFGAATVVFGLSTNLVLSLLPSRSSARRTWSAWSSASRWCSSGRPTRCAAG